MAPFGCILAVMVDYEKIAHALWDLLDSIDTANDRAKNDDVAFREIVNRLHPKRFRYLKSDGYNLTPVDGAAPIPH